MERVLLYLDNLDDVVHAIAFVGERRGRGIVRVILHALMLLFAGSGILVAFHEPALAAGIMTLLAVCLLYQSATAPRPSSR